MHKNPPCLEDNINQILLLAWKSFRDTERRAVSVVDLLSIKICVDDNSLDDISNILKIVQRKIDLLNYSKEQLCKFKSYLLNVMFI